MPYLTFMPFHIAQEEGYFAAQDLEVEFVRLPRIQELMTGLARGEVDVAAGMLTTTVLNSIAGGARMRLVGALGHLPSDCAFSGAVVRRELLTSGALEDPERLRRLAWDADILIPYGYWMERIIAPYGLTVEDLTIVNLPEATAVESLLAGSIDITFVTEPFLGALGARPEAAALWRDFGEVVPGYQLSNLMFGPTLLDERPEVAERFAVAMLQAIRQYMHGKTPRNLEIVEAATGLTAEQTREACWPAARSDGLIPEGAFTGYQEWMLKQGLVEGVLQDGQFIEPRFMERANELLATEASR
jgi:NitT/TauT family transport system substrate-binding protein